MGFLFFFLGVLEAFTLAMGHNMSQSEVPISPPWTLASGGPLHEPWTMAMDGPDWLVVEPYPSEKYESQLGL